MGVMSEENKGAPKSIGPDVCEAALANLRSELECLSTTDNRFDRERTVAALASLDTIEAAHKRAWDTIYSVSKDVIRLREALEASEEAWTIFETAAGVSNTYGIPIGNVSKIRAQRAGAAVRAAIDAARENRPVNDPELHELYDVWKKQV